MQAFEPCISPDKAAQALDCQALNPRMGANTNNAVTMVLWVARHHTALALLDKNSHQSSVFIKPFLLLSDHYAFDSGEA